MAQSFHEQLKSQFEKGLFLCVGLDTDIEKVPDSARRNSVRETIVFFNKAIIEATKDLVCAFKPNSAFYEAHGDIGFLALRETIQYIHQSAPDVPVILDAKRGDMENTNQAYASAVFDYLKADAVTVHPYLGREGAQPFLDRKDKGVIVLCKTSNPGAKEFQDLVVDGMPLYQRIAKNVAEEWNTNGNCGLVVGATYPKDLKQVRTIAPTLPILLPGIGAQGGNLAECMHAGMTASKGGIMVSVSRSVIYASVDERFDDAAREKALEINREIQAALVQ